MRIPVRRVRSVHRLPPTAHAPARRTAPEAARALASGGVPGAFVLLNVLSKTECVRLTAIAEAIGYTPDHPLARPAPSGIGGLEWLFDVRARARWTALIIGRRAPCFFPRVEATRHCA